MPKYEENNIVVFNKIIVTGEADPIDLNEEVRGTILRNHFILNKNCETIPAYSIYPLNRKDLSLVLVSEEHILRKE